jgi:hypothetical protein
VRFLSLLTSVLLLGQFNLWSLFCIFLSLLTAILLLALVFASPTASLPVFYVVYSETARKILRRLFRASLDAGQPFRFFGYTPACSILKPHRGSAHSLLRKSFGRVKIIIFTSPNDARVSRGEAVIAGHLPPVGSRLPDLAEIELRGCAIPLSSDVRPPARSVLSVVSFLVIPLSSDVRSPASISFTSI